MESRGKAVKIKITHEPQEREQAEAVFQAVQRLLPRSRQHETQQDGRRILYLTTRHGPQIRGSSSLKIREKSEEVFNKQRGNREKFD